MLPTLILRRKFARRASPTRKIRAAPMDRRFACPKASLSARPGPRPHRSRPRASRFLYWFKSGLPTSATLAGVIARGYCRHTDTKVRVYDTEGQLLGTDTLRPGDNVSLL